MRNLRLFGAVSLCALGCWGCAATTSSSSTSGPAAASVPPPSPAGTSTSAESQGDAAAKAEAVVAARLVFSLEGAGLAAPEAIVHDAEQDVYFVSNVNGDPLKKDANGFISKVSPEGQVLELKFIDGAQGKTTLDAPKGMTIVGDLLYVADINWVKIFDRKSGAPRGRLFAKGSSFLNSVAAAEDNVLITDSGWKSSKNGFENTGTDAVFRIDPKKVVIEPYLVDKTLGNPNGIVGSATGVFVVTGSGDLFALRVSGEGKQRTVAKGEVTKLPAGFLDGVVALDDGSFLVSSWAGQAVYRGKAGGAFQAVVKDLPSPAAIGFDSKRGRLLIPSMNEDRFLCYELSQKRPTEAAVAPKPRTVQPDAAPAPPAPVPPPGGAAPVAVGQTSKKVEPVKVATATAAAATPAPAAASAVSASPAKAAKPAKPSHPEKPAQSVKTPAAGAEPAQHGSGAGVATTAAPKAAPAKPAEPAKAEPAQRVEAAKPASPAEPAQHAEPAKPAKPADPARHAEATKPTTSTKAAEPAKRAAPAKPADQAKHADGAEQGEHAESAKSGESTKQGESGKSGGTGKSEKK